MKKIYVLVLILSSITSLSACADHSAWQGTYNYEAALGENVAEDAILINYVLTISDHNCSLQIDGYQIYEAIICNAGIHGDHLTVSFVSYGDGSVKNIYDVSVYTVGEALFSLSHKDQQLLTTWDELTPDESLPQTGIYFVKQ